MLTREFNLRDAEAAGDGRTLVLACVPYDTPTWVDDGDGPYREGFRRGAFRHVVKAANRVELRYDHRQGPLPYGFGVDLVEDSTHLIGSFRVAPGDQGDQMLALVRDGQLAGVSIGFVPGSGEDGADDGGAVLWRTTVKRLTEVSLTPAAAYTGADVLALRVGPPPRDAAASARGWITVQKLRQVGRI